MIKLGCCVEMMGQHLNTKSTSKVAASFLVGASKTMALTSLKVPQSHLKSSIMMYSGSNNCSSVSMFLRDYFSIR
jgi:hypothetical protein